MRERERTVRMALPFASSKETALSDPCGPLVSLLLLENLVPFLSSFLFFKFKLEVLSPIRRSHVDCLTCSPFPSHTPLTIPLNGEGVTKYP